MFRKSLLLLAALSIALMFSSCDGGKSSFSTDNFKKFVEKSKNNGDMSYEKTKKAYKGVFPNMKMK
jgi:hypothetical protein